MHLHCYVPALSRSGSGMSGCVVQPDSDVKAELQEVKAQLAELKELLQEALPSLQPATSSS